MMTLYAIYTYLDTLSPFAVQEKWDNSGLLIGDWEHEIDTIVVSLDLDETIMEHVNEKTLVITHHPLLFGGIKQIQYDRYPDRLVIDLIRRGGSLISMHTNIDQTHLNRYVATILGYPILKEEPFLITMEVEESFETCAHRIKHALGLEHLRLVQSHTYLKTLALCTGSGASLWSQMEAQCLLTGDIKYHDAMAAQSVGKSMMDIGHYESERYFGELVAEYLKNLGLNVILAPSKNPFSYL